MVNFIDIHVYPSMHFFRLHNLIFSPLIVQAEAKSISENMSVSIRTYDKYSQLMGHNNDNNKAFSLFLGGASNKKPILDGFLHAQRKTTKKS